MKTVGEIAHELQMQAYESDEYVFGDRIPQPGCTSKPYRTYGDDICPEKPNDKDCQQCIFWRPQPAGAEPVEQDKNKGVLMVKLSQLYPNPNNPRKRFDQEALNKLTESIRQVGVLEPLLVVADNGRYRIIAGERRYRAALAAGLREVPVIIRDLTPEQEFEVMLTENLQRADLDPIEEAQAFQLAISRGWKQTELAEKLGISQAQVANRLRLLKLPAEVQDLISREIISPGHGLALVKVAAAPKLVQELAKEFTERDVPVAQAGETVDFQITRVGKPLFSMTYNPPLFDTQETCIKSKCKMRVQVHGRRFYGDDEEHPYCLNPECWEKHQIETRQRKVEEKIQEIAQSRDEISEILKLPEISHSDYRAFHYYSTVKIEECPGDCEHLKDAIDHDEDIIKVCINPACYDQMVKAKEQERTREARMQKKAFEDRKKGILEMAALRDNPPRRILLYMATQVIYNPVYSSSWTRDKIRKRFYKDRGWELPDYKNPWNYKKEIEDLVKHLAELSDKELWQVILYGLLRGIDEDDYVFNLTLGEELQAWVEHLAEE